MRVSVLELAALRRDDVGRALPVVADEDDLALRVAGPVSLGWGVRERVGRRGVAGQARRQHAGLGRAALGGGSSRGRAGATRSPAEHSREAVQAPWSGLRGGLKRSHRAAKRNRRRPRPRASCASVNPRRRLSPPYRQSDTHSLSSRGTVVPGVSCGAQLNTRPTVRSVRNSCGSGGRCSSARTRSTPDRSCLASRRRRRGRPRHPRAPKLRSLMHRGGRSRSETRSGALRSTRASISSARRDALATWSFVAAVKACGGSALSHFSMHRLLGDARVGGPADRRDCSELSIAQPHVGLRRRTAPSCSSGETSGFVAACGSVSPEWALLGLASQARPPVA